MAVGKGNGLSGGVDYRRGSFGCRLSARIVVSGSRWAHADPRRHSMTPRRRGGPQGDASTILTRGKPMWTLIKGLLLKWAMLKWLLKSLGSLGILVPIAFVLKMVGLPVLMVLAVLALPILIMLALFGMPFILVFMLGGALLAILSAVLSFGLMALKIVLPIVLVVWLV